MDGKRGTGSVVALSRKKSDANSQYIPVHDVREAFAMIETVDDAVKFFEKHGPLDDNKECSLSQIRSIQERLKHTRQMDHGEFSVRKKTFDTGTSRLLSRRN